MTISSKLKKIKSIRGIFHVLSTPILENNVEPICDKDQNRKSFPSSTTPYFRMSKKKYEKRRVSYQPYLQPGQTGATTLCMTCRRIF